MKSWMFRTISAFRRRPSRPPAGLLMKTNLPMTPRGYMGVLVATLGVGYAFVWEKNRLHAKELRAFSLEEVQKHDSESKGIWVTYKNAVYDITDFVPKHPGAKNVVMAAGGPVEPFWEIYAVHKNNPEVLKMLEEYRIGNLREEDVSKVNDITNSFDPFANEPTRHPILKPSSTKPFNAETPAEVLVEKFLTPNDLFYVRSHLPTPDLKSDSYELEFGGIGLKERTLSLQDLKKYPKHSVIAAVQCGGNRRSEMNRVKALKGLDWGPGAIGNAKWSGARLSDVLEGLGFSEKNKEDGLHLQFEGHDLGADGSPYGASIPLSMGLDSRRDVILAYEMNDKVLPRDHGYPIRVIVPGVVGARNVKWLNKVFISDEESDSHWQQNDYKGFNPSVTWDNVDFRKSPAIQNMPVTSAICVPEANKIVKTGDALEIKGYAWSGGGNRIIRVDITTDNGSTWTEAELLHQDDKREPRHYGWTLFRAVVQVPKNVKEFKVKSKAVDSSYNVQPESFENIWNLRGLLSNAYFTATFKVE